MRGNLYLIIGPSGVGKTTLVNEVVKTVGNIRLSVSYTTRDKRKGEVNGKDYWFVDSSTFERLHNEGELLECEVVHGNLYGTSQQKIEENIKNGIDVVCVIDFKGASNILRSLEEKKSMYGSEKHIDVSSIFILPPTKQTLKRRLNLRATDDVDSIDARLELSDIEINSYDEFDFVVVNDSFVTAVEEIKDIIFAKRLLRTKNPERYKSLVEELLC